MRWRGVISVFVLLLTWAAIDDITTDTSPSGFAFERGILVVSAKLFAGIGAWLVVRRRKMLGLATLAAVAIGIAGFWSLPHRGEHASAVNYLGLVPLVWCFGLMVWLLVARNPEASTHSAADRATRAGDFRVPHGR